MRMKIAMLALAGASMLTLSGCAVMSKDAHVRDRGGMDAEAMSIAARPTEYTVDEIGDSSGTATTTHVLGFLVAGDSVDAGLPILGNPGENPLVKLASYRAATAKGGDAFYHVTTEKDSFGFGFIYKIETVKVTGRALKVKNLGTMSAERTDKLNLARALSSSTGNSFFSSKKEGLAGIPLIGGLFGN